MGKETKRKRKSAPAALTPAAADLAITTSAPSVRKRPNLTIRLTAELYGEIQKAADRAGRSLSEEVERRLETAAEWNGVFESVAAFKARYEADRVDLERGDTEAVLPRRGYTKVFDTRFGGHAWLPPGHLPAAHEQIINQAEFREFQAAKKATEETAKETPINQQLEDLERQIRSLRLAVQKDERTR
jgi:hypothetical protein